MLQFDFTVNDPLGIHARPAGNLAKLAKSFAGTTVSITKEGKTVQAAQMMKLMAMAIKQGQQITVSVEGGDEQAAFEAVKQFFEQNLA